MSDKKGVLLVNLGSPAAPTAKAVKVYLSQLLSDHRMVSLPSYLWQPLLHLFFLPLHTAKFARRYRQVWDDQLGSPLHYYTKRQAMLLQAVLPDYTVRYATSYSSPSINSVLSEFEHERISSLTVIPLYPEYSTMTVGAIHTAIEHFYAQRQTMPDLHLVSDYSDFEPYITALATKIRNAVKRIKPDCVLFSYHDIPKHYADTGDPYKARCNRTTSALLRRLNLIMPCFQSYQSQFWPIAWLQPRTAATVKGLAEEGYTNILVIAPSFVSDCLETIDELANQTRASFLQAGGQHFHLLSALNDDATWIDALAQLAHKYDPIQRA